MNPEIKIILIVCDPVNRAYSDFAQVIKRKEFPNIVEYIPDGDIEDDHLRMTSFEKFINDYLEKTEAKRGDLSDEDFIHWVRTVYRWVQTRKIGYKSRFSHTPEASIISNGLYWVHIKEWLEIGFQKDQMMIINGEELITNPAKIILEAQDFMNLDPIIKEENFIFDKEKGTVSKNASKLTIFENFTAILMNSFLKWNKDFTAMWRIKVRNIRIVLLMEKDELEKMEGRNIHPSSKQNYTRFSNLIMINYSNGLEMILDGIQIFSTFSCHFKLWLFKEIINKLNYFVFSRLWS